MRTPDITNACGQSLTFLSHGTRRPLPMRKYTCRRHWYLWASCIHEISSFTDEHSNHISAILENYMNSGQQRPAATGRAKQQPGAARSAPARPEPGTAEPAAQRKAWSGHRQELISREPRRVGGVLVLKRSEVTFATAAIRFSPCRESSQRRAETDLLLGVKAKAAVFSIARATPRSLGGDPARQP